MRLRVIAPISIRSGRMDDVTCTSDAGYRMSLQTDWRSGSRAIGGRVG